MARHHHHGSARLSMHRVQSAQRSAMLTKTSKERILDSKARGTQPTCSGCSPVTFLVSAGSVSRLRSLAVGKGFTGPVRGVRGAVNCACHQCAQQYHLREAYRRKIGALDLPAHQNSTYVHACWQTAQCRRTAATLQLSSTRARVDVMGAMAGWWRRPTSGGSPCTHTIQISTQRRCASAAGLPHPEYEAHLLACLLIETLHSVRTLCCYAWVSCSAQPQ
jgi:hypothetical protein